MRKRIVLLCAMILLFTCPSAWAAQEYLVTGHVVPIYESPKAGTLAPKDGWKTVPEEDENVLTTVVYGNRLECSDAKGAAKWLEVFAEGGSLGFAEKRFFTPFPKHDAFDEPRSFWVSSDGVIPSLFPGERPLTEHDPFALPLGVTILVEGSAEKDGKSWLLCRFEGDLAQGGSDGFGGRYAWIRASDAVDLAKYEPDTSKVQEEWLPKTLSDTKRTALLAKGFSIDPTPLIPEWIVQDDMVDRYNTMTWQTPKFITADLPLHAFHLYFDRMLQKVEEEVLLPRTAELLTAMRLGLTSLREEMTGPSGKEAATLVEDYLDVAMFLLTNGGTELSDRGAGIATNIQEGGIARSPFTGAEQDYSLFAPRGHYTLNDDFKSYFRTTYLLGTPFPLDKPHGAAATLLLCRLLDLSDVQSAWRSLVDPVLYLVGSSNVNSWDDLNEVAKRYDLATLEDSAAMDRLMADLDKVAKESAIQRLPGKKFAVMPRRITFDAFIFDNLTSPAIGTPDKERKLPAPEDVMAILGSKSAGLETERYKETPGYEEKAGELVKQWPDYEKSTKGQNVYTSWLSLYDDYFEGSASKQFFAGTPQWDYKKLLTASGSMAELKHDTILYAEQSGAELGGPGGDWTPAPYALPFGRGYVEPEPKLFAGLAACARKIVTFLEPMFSDEYEHYRYNLTAFAAIMDRLSDMAGRAVSDTMIYDDFAELATFFLPSVLPEGIGEANAPETQHQIKMALVADVATDPGVGALHTAIGTPREISVYVNDRGGGARVATGYVFSYYSFVRPLSEGRMNDDQWKEIVYDEKRQDELEELRPAWYRQHLEP
ncbi:MAG TPA: hypothetical protein DIC53_04415 [Synergistaceae bacterium]|nr:hypothetical protein [Synergistaceae bacterium]